MLATFSSPISCRTCNNLNYIKFCNFEMIVNFTNFGFLRNSLFFLWHAILNLLFFEAWFFVTCNVGSTVYLSCLAFMIAVTERASGSCCVFISAQSGNFSIDHDTLGSHPHCTYPHFSAFRQDSLQGRWPLKRVGNSYKCDLCRSTMYTHVGLEVLK